jgi:hypothetical protein
MVLQLLYTAPQAKALHHGLVNQARCAPLAGPSGHLRAGIETLTDLKEADCD